MLTFMPASTRPPRNQEAVNSPCDVAGVLHLLLVLVGDGQSRDALGCGDIGLGESSGGDVVDRRARGDDDARVGLDEMPRMAALMPFVPPVTGTLESVK